MADQRAELAARQDDARKQIADAQEQADAAETAMQTARDTQEEADKHAAAVNEQLDEREEELDRREAALEPREADAAKSKFGSGVHLVGVDINPGTYRAAGGNYCYWERLSGTSGEFDDLIANGGVEGAVVVTISPSDVAFSSSGCGTWSKAG
ncbi:hypothetical protein EF834_13325 [Rhodococcus spongiicola]|uniref:Uncharacterized protein n=1 Tax=Rhodococcus spongiicola TaxID=2487352 RepID=A0A438AUY3_9NOCA|nr:hypothetical protein EF834_13325 [Rhodococcus spongiicola]